MKTDLTKEERLAILSKVNKAIIKKEEKKGFNAKVGFLGDKHMEGVGIFELKPTQIYSLDKFLGGGIPMGGHVHIAGAPDCGKTTTMLNLIGSCQKAGMICAFADAEGKFDHNWAEKQGVNTGELVFGQFDVAEAMFEWIKESAPYVDIFVIDSLTALASRQMVQKKSGTEKDFDDQTMAVLAKLVPQYLRVVQPTVVKNKSSVFVINHLYSKMDLFGSQTTGGGNAIKYWNILELWMGKSKIESMKDEAFMFKATCKKGHYTGAPKQNSFMETLFVMNEGFNHDYENLMKAYDNLIPGVVIETDESHTVINIQGENFEFKATDPVTVFKKMQETVDEHGVSLIKKLIIEQKPAELTSKKTKKKKNEN